MTELINRSATEMVAMLSVGEISPTDALDSLEKRIAVVDGRVNALPIRFLDAARAAAAKWTPPVPGTARAVLAGLPVAIKDYNDVAGQLTTNGFRGAVEHRAPKDDAVVARLRAAGALPYAKTNVPEIAGGHTYNEIWGVTRNPWHLDRTAGGSSGGSAAALASGMAWLATGNDLGGSLRTPSGYNGTVGLRPTAGTIARGRPAVPFDALFVEGPMARDVRDTALLLDAMAGADRHDPLSREPATRYRKWVDREPGRFRAGFSLDLGTLPVHAEVRRVVGDAVKHVEAAGGDVTTDCPDFSGAYDTFQVLRAHLLASLHDELFETQRELLKSDIVWNIEFGRALTSQRLREAERARGELAHRVIDFFDDHDVLICPTAPLPAFPADWSWPKSIDGFATMTYIDWIAITFFISLTGCPVLALPCGRTAEGTPIGFQIVGPPRSEGMLFSIGAQIEKSVSLAPQLPITPVLTS
ncbi:amidase [Nocardia sp. NPDC004750]